MFWIVKVPDSAVQISPDGSSLTIHLENVPVVDAFSFPPPLPNGIAPDEVDIAPYALVRARTSFDITYTKTNGTARRIRPATDDPLSPLNWAGEMWNATNSGSFSVTYDDGTFSASGTFDSSGNFGEMGAERNGLFVHHDEDGDNNDDQTGPEFLSLPVQPAPLGQLAVTAVSKRPEKSVLLKGRVRVKVAD